MKKAKAGLELWLSGDGVCYSLLHQKNRQTKETIASEQKAPAQKTTIIVIPRAQKPIRSPSIALLLERCMLRNALALGLLRRSQQ